MSYAGKTALVVFAGGGRMGSGLCRRWLRASQVSDNMRMVAVVRGNPRDYVHSAILSDVFQQDRDWMVGTPYFNPKTNALYVQNRFGRTAVIQFVQHAGAPEELKWGRGGSEQAILIEASGELTDPKKCRRFVDGRVADQVMVTAPLKGDDAAKYPHVVFGVNEEVAVKSDLISWASCTTNGAWLPWYVLIAKLSRLKILGGKLITIHAVTNTQNILAKSVDGAKSMTTLDSILPIATGFSKAGGVVMYWLARTGRDIDVDVHGFKDVGGGALRVPTSTCSIIEQDAIIETSTPLDKYNLNALFLAACLEGNLAGNLGFTLDPAVTTRALLGEERTSVINGAQTSVTPLGGDRYFVSWETFYDNEAGYVAQGWSVLAFVLAQRNWGMLETSRLSAWPSFFTHFDPRLDRTLASLKLKDVYSLPEGMAPLSDVEMRTHLTQRRSEVVDPRPHSERKEGRVLAFKPPREGVSVDDDYAAMARWFDDYEVAA